MSYDPEVDSDLAFSSSFFFISTASLTRVQYEYVSVCVVQYVSVCTVCVSACGTVCVSACGTVCVSMCGKLDPRKHRNNAMRCVLVGEERDGEVMQL